MYHLIRAGGLLIAALLAATPLLAADPPQAEIVVAMRYFQQTGTSHAHLYLYRADGKFLRQLTDDNKSQDFDPCFAPDGETIVFTRQADAGGKEFYSIEPRGGNLHQLPAAPDWYAGAKDSPFFASLDDDPDAGRLYTGGDTPAGAPLKIRAPDGSAELILRVGGADASANPEGPGHLYVLRDLPSGKETALGKLPGFTGLVDVLALGRDKDQRFLFSLPLRLTFFGLHLGSTDGTTTIALDLNGKRLVQLSPNGSTQFPLPGEPAFLTLTENRYVPFGDGKRTANCSYVERWNADLKPTRYAKEKAPGVTYGASMYRPARTPAVVRIVSNGP